jgi:hypothetical protein
MAKNLVKTLVQTHVLEAKRMRRAAVKMAALPDIAASFRKLAKDQIAFARFCKDKNR